jgi:superfamily II DNA or RNA helicase
MNLSNSLKLYFSPQAIRLGQQRFEKADFRLYKDEPYEVRSINIDVHGLMSNKDPLRSMLQWIDQELKGRCSCEQYQEGIPCEHLWALVLAAEQKNFADHIGVQTLTTFALENQSHQAPQQDSPAGREWMALLRKDLRSFHEELPHDEEKTKKNQPFTHELWFGLLWDCPGPSPGRNELPLLLTTKDLKTGKFKPYYPSDETLNLLNHPSDRAWASLLRYLTPTTLSPYWRQKLGRHKRSIVFLPSVGLAEHLVGLAKTGRLYLSCTTFSIDSPPLPLNVDKDYHHLLSLKLEPRGEHHLELDIQFLSQGQAQSAHDFKIDIDRKLIIQDQRLGFLKVPSGLDLSLKKLVEKPVLLTKAQADELRACVESPQGDFLQSTLRGLDQLNLAVEFPSPEAVFKMTVAPSVTEKVMITGELLIHYPEVRSPLLKPLTSNALPEGNGPESLAVRNFTDEQLLVDAVKNLSGITPLTSEVDGQFYIENTQLLKLLSDFQELNISVYLDEKKIFAPRRYGSHVTAKDDWFEVKTEIEFSVDSDEHTSLDLLDLSTLKTTQSFAGLNFISLGNKGLGVVPEDWLKKQLALAQMARIDGDQVFLHSSQALTLDLLLEENRVKLENISWGEVRQRAKSSITMGLVAPAGNLVASLRPYQLEGLNWFLYLSKLELGGCLADDMGLGKTLQTLAFLEEQRYQNTLAQSELLPSLIVVPKTLLGNWKKEAKKFTPKLGVIGIEGTPLQREATYRELSSMTGGEVIIVTYGTLLRDAARLKGFKFQNLILDEAQVIKNPDTLSYKACQLISAKSRFALSGTPAQNRLSELTSLFRLLIPKIFQQKLPVDTVDRADEVLREKILSSLQAFILRRTKDEVLKDLPEKIETVLEIEMDHEHKDFYESLKRTLQEQFRPGNKEKAPSIHPLEALLRLRQAASHPKLVAPKYAGRSSKFDVLLEKLEEIVHVGSKALVFSQFTNLLDLLEIELQKKSIKTHKLTGKTVQRDKVIDDFTQEKSPSVFLLSLKAAGVGLNLTQANYTFILDPWWNPSQESQAVDRAHRLGQTSTVFSYKLIAMGTVEEKILKLQARKQQLMNSVQTMDQFSPEESFEFMQILMDA